MQKIAAIYARVSSKKQKEGETIQSQLDALRRYAKEKEYCIPNGWEFTDDGYSGATLLRPALDELRDIAREGSLDAILVLSPDRLSRKYSYQILLKEELKKLGVMLEFIKNPPARTAEEQLLEHFQGIFAEYERAQITERCRRGRLYKAKLGLVSALPSIPFGYRRVRNENQLFIEIDPEASDIVKEIFRLYTQEEMPLRTIAKELDIRGIKPPKGGKAWDRTTIKGILENPAYTGSAYFGKTQRSDGVEDRIVRHASGRVFTHRYARQKRPQETWIEIPIPEFISEQHFQLAQEKLKSNKRFASRSTKRPSLLQGLLMCGCCGKSYYKKERQSTKGRIAYYCCRSSLIGKSKECQNRSLRTEELDQLIFKELIKMLKNPKLIKEEIQRRQVENSSDNQGFMIKEAELKKELNQIFKARDKLLDAYQNSEALNLDELNERMNKLNKRKNALEKDLDGLKTRRMHKEIELSYSDMLKDFEKRLGDAPETLPFADKRKIIRLLIDEIVIEKNEIKIKHCVPIHETSNKNGLLCGVDRF